MIVNKQTIEKELEKHSPFPLEFEWMDQDNDGTALRITVPIGTKAGIPQILVAFPPKMPVVYIPKAIARAKQLIDEIFDANMVGIRFANSPAPSAKPRLIVPHGIAIDKLRQPS